MKKLLFVIIGFICVVTANAQTMKELFVSMPDTLSLVLTKNNRADCVDFIASKMEAKVTNRFDNTSEVTVLTDDYLKADITECSSWEMRRLPVNDSIYVICMITTVSGPVKDSNVCFYSTNWEELPKSQYIESFPVADDFFIASQNIEEADSIKELRKKSYITFIQASLSEKDTSLSFTYTTPDYMNKEDGEKLKLYMRRDPLQYEWKNGKYVRKQ